MDPSIHKVLSKAKVYTVKITEKKNEIARLQENINNCSDAIADLHKQNESSKESCNVRRKYIEACLKTLNKIWDSYIRQVYRKICWKPTYVILSKHEEYLKNELEALQESTENERKMYQDYITQYKEILKQHREKYAETPLAQEYYKKKKEFEEIQNRVLKRSEKYKLKEDACLDILGTTIINAFPVEPTFEETTEDQNNSKMIEGKNQKSLEKPKEFKERYT
ncbi:protein hypothetical protein [Limosa lapponica baueri]|uniref:Uncharacterized protein n=1 Tax=Limosa lapponica baueri TaxID=1758121 RepID=A0A2I0THC5_LIMLA|nr:protein hypothetical protein [Limosa lapponica baueri]